MYTIQFMSKSGVSKWLGKKTITLFVEPHNISTFLFYLRNRIFWCNTRNVQPFQNNISFTCIFMLLHTQDTREIQRIHFTIFFTESKYQYICDKKSPNVWRSRIHNY